MATRQQETGSFGETLVAKLCPCPRCKKPKTLKRLPANFKCADIICDFCGYLAQVKTTNVRTIAIDAFPAQIPGAAWGVQRERMRAGIYFPIFLVLRAGRRSVIYYLPVEFQTRSMFRPRKKLSRSARRAGWQGYFIDLEKAARIGHIVPLMNGA